MVAGLGERVGDAPVTVVVSVTVEVEAPPERVWEVVANPANLPHWNRHIVRVSGVPEGGLAQGVAYVSEMRFVAVHA